MDSDARVRALRGRARREWRFVSRVPLRDLAKPQQLARAHRVRNYSMLDYPRLGKLYELARDVEVRGVPGSFVECGVARGGAAGLVATALSGSREIWLFDSWQGVPKPSAIDISEGGKPGLEGMAAVSEDEARHVLFHALKLDPARFRLVKGWFEETIPEHRAELGPIALLHLDVDWYESYRFCLEQLYDLVSPGGYVIADDYAYWKGCRAAVDEFVAAADPPIELRRAGVAVHFRKPG
jgi:O-methyltransferase